MYNYNEERVNIFTDEGQRRFIKMRDWVLTLLNKSGACTMDKAMMAMSGDTWSTMSLIDRMVEIGDIKEITKNMDVAGQDRVFVKA